MNSKERQELLEPIVGSSGNVHVGQMIIGDKNTANYYEKESADTSIYSDQQIANAIKEISGKGKPLSLMRHYMGVICVLQSMGWSHKFAACCTIINSLPGHDSFPVRCESGALKKTQIMKFVSKDYEDWATYEPRSIEERALFNECKLVADSFVSALRNSPQ